jgi:hypothetical protein
MPGNWLGQITRIALFQKFNFLPPDKLDGQNDLIASSWTF